MPDTVLLQSTDKECDIDTKLGDELSSTINLYTDLQNKYYNYV